MLDKQTLGTIAKSILDEYNTGTMASERHLQAVLLNLLRPLLRKNQSILIEPNIITQDKESLINGLIPDMLIIDQVERFVRTIIEIKYVPYAYPKYQKDFETFVAFRSSIDKTKTKIYLKGRPKDGNWDTDVLFHVATDLELIYIVIAKYDADLFERTPEIVNKYLDNSGQLNFQPLFILINPDNDPEKSEIRLKVG